jgi:hypothetical protein
LALGWNSNGVVRTFPTLAGASVDALRTCNDQFSGRVLCNAIVALAAIGCLVVAQGDDASRLFAVVGGTPELACASVDTQVTNAGMRSQIVYMGYNSWSDEARRSQRRLAVAFLVGTSCAAGRGTTLDGLARGEELTVADRTYRGGLARQRHNLRGARFLSWLSTQDHRPIRHDNRHRDDRRSTANKKPGKHLGNFPRAFSHLALIEAMPRMIVVKRRAESKTWNEL